LSFSDSVTMPSHTAQPGSTRRVCLIALAAVAESGGEKAVAIRRKLQVLEQKLVEYHRLEAKMMDAVAEEDVAKAICCQERLETLRKNLATEDHLDDSDAIAAVSPWQRLRYCFASPLARSQFARPNMQRLQVGSIVFSKASATAIDISAASTFLDDGDEWPEADHHEDRQPIHDIVVVEDWFALPKLVN